MLQPAIAERNHIEPQITARYPSLKHIPLGSLGEIFHLGRRHSLRRVSERRCHRGFHFDKHQQALLPGDDIDLFVAGPPVSLDNLKAQLFEKRYRLIFKTLTDSVLTVGVVFVIS